MFEEKKDDKEYRKAIHTIINHLLIGAKVLKETYNEEPLIIRNNEVYIEIKKPPLFD